MLDSEIPTHGMVVYGRAVSNPGSPNADMITPTTSLSISLSIATTAFDAHSKPGSSTIRELPKDAVVPFIFQFEGAFIRAISTIWQVIFDVVFGLINRICTIDSRNICIKQLGEKEACSSRNSTEG